MKITIKTIKGEAFSVEVEPNQKISEVKALIQSQKGIDADSQKLIARGTNTQDENTLEHYNIKDGDFMVVMILKKQSQKVEQQSLPQQQVQPQQLPQQQAQPQQQTQPQQLTQPQRQPQLPQQQQQPQQVSQESQLMQEQLNKTLDEMVNMGFSREEAKAAMRAAYNDPDRAIEYLLNGIPAQQQSFVPQQQQQQQQQQYQQQGGLFQQGQSLQQGGVESPLSFLNQNPQFLQIRQAIRQNPQLLQILLSQIAQSNPQLFQLINQNQEEFSRWIEEGDGGEQAQYGQGQGGYPGSHMIQVSEEEKAAIDRLCELGFQKQLVIEAFLACDRNEALAANYLFDSQMEEQFLGGHQQQWAQQPQQQSQSLLVQQPQQQDQPVQKEEEKNENQQQQNNQGQEQKPQQNNDKKDDNDDNIFS